MYSLCTNICLYTQVYIPIGLFSSILPNTGSLKVFTKIYPFRLIRSRPFVALHASGGYVTLCISV